MCVCVTCVCVCVCVCVCGGGFMVLELRNCEKVEVAVLGGRSGWPSSSLVSNTYGFCGRKATIKRAHELC